MGERTFGQEIVDLCKRQEPFVLGVDYSTSEGAAEHDDWSVQTRDQRFAARQVGYALIALESLQRD